LSDISDGGHDGSQSSSEINDEEELSTGSAYAMETQYVNLIL
jgi:hypothetical protein